MENRPVQRIKTISAYHQVRGLPPPAHPLISIIDYAAFPPDAAMGETNWVFDFYLVSVKRGIEGKMTYGQQQYDFDEGVMFFMAPHQLFSILPQSRPAGERSGWLLLIHPDFFWNTALATSISHYEFFDYSVHEALFLSEQEEATLNGIIANIRQEYHTNLDRFSKGIIIAHIEALLNYAERFYHRQFLTREKAAHQILDKLEQWLNGYFNSPELAVKGLPTVQQLADSLHVSPKYLSGLLKVLTGQSTQQHLHEKLIEKAKEKLSTTTLSVSEIAYELGFEHSQSFNKLFKAKTSLSPLAFRKAFQ